MSKKPKLCKDCKHRTSKEWQDSNEWECKASLTTTLDLVDGTTDEHMNTCEDERQAGDCGTEGKRWVKK